MQSELVEQLVEKLARMVENHGDGRLPSMSELSRHFGVSRPTLAKAAHILRARGLVTFTKGQRMRVGGRALREVPLPHRSAPDWLAHLVMRRIADGELRTGDVLPKGVYLVAHGRHSASTVSRALRGLAARDAIHKRGNRWIVGPAEKPLEGGFARVLRPPTVLVIMERLVAWRELCMTDPAMHFCQAFISEAERRGILIEQAITEPFPYSERVHPSGMMAVVDRMRQMGDCFLGALLVGTHARIPGLEEWITTILRQRRPVVWFDLHNEGLRDRTLAKERSFTRCCFDESVVGSAALEVLERFGHRTVGCPVPSKALSPQRFDESLAQTSNLNIISHPFPGDFWNRLFHVHDPLGETQRLAQRGLPHVRVALSPYAKMDRIAALKALREFSRHTRGYTVSLSPVLTPYLRDPRVTVLVAPNNDWAKRYYYWLSAAGVRMPNHLSLLSLGNNLESQALPISTIDYGLDTLGYNAIHAILQDVPLSPCARNTITARPRLINRGSLAQPRQHAIDIALEGELW